MHSGRRIWLQAVVGTVCVACGSAAVAAPAVELLSADTIFVSGDARVVAADGEPSWVYGGFGKTRFGADEKGLRPRLALGSGNLVWQPKLGWALSATVVGSVQQRARLEAGLSEAYLSFKPLGDGALSVSARAGLMWPPVSLEHTGPDWVVRDTITPSAINSWIGEEVKVVGAEVTLGTRFKGGKVSATGAVFDADDTAGALLTFRGWALHDLTALAWRKQPLPPLAPAISDYQPRYSHPLKEIDGGFLKRPGWYVRLAWQLAAPVRVEAIHYDNGGNPEAADQYMEWGWRTRFDNIGVTAELAPATTLRAQAMEGRTRMGLIEDGRRWIDDRFHSAFALITQRLSAKTSVSLRGEAFDTRNSGGEVSAADNDRGWAFTAAAKHELGSGLTGLVEALHVDSRRTARERIGVAPHQAQNQLQGSMRFRW